MCEGVGTAGLAELAPFEIGILRLLPGDTILLRVRGGLTEQALERLRESARRAMNLVGCSSHPVVVLEGDVEIGVLRRAGESDV